LTFNLMAFDSEEVIQDFLNYKISVRNRRIKRLAKRSGIEEFKTEIFKTKIINRIYC
jgi:hypothetical protein